MSTRSAKETYELSDAEKREVEPSVVTRERSMTLVPVNVG